MDDSIDVQGVHVPAFMYGTAWKEGRTEELVGQALSVGFRAIDTANQRKHYNEAAVGAAIAASGVPRSEIFLQTKFTYASGQDHRPPYDLDAPLATQVRQSFDSSLQHLGAEVIDSFVLHGPWHGRGWSPEDSETWRTFEALFADRRVHLLGVSNVTLQQLATLCAESTVTPAFVQNRCFAANGWDHDVRAFCRDSSIVYQGFSLLTANRRELAGPVAKTIADRLGATVPQVVFRFARAVGILPLTGTSDPIHMQQDLQSARLELSSADVGALERIGLPHH